MSLKNLKVAQATIKVPPDGEFVVRGISLSDLNCLVACHGKPLSDLYNEFVSEGQEVALTDATSLAQSLLAVAPQVAAHVIALASGGDSEDDMVVARSLSFAVQVEALEKIGELTFATEGGPKKVVETVIRIANGTAGLMQSLQG